MNANASTFNFPPAAQLEKLNGRNYVFRRWPGRHEWKQIECGEKMKKKSGQEVLLELIVCMCPTENCFHLHLNGFWNENVTLNIARYQSI